MRINVSLRLGFWGPTAPKHLAMGFKDGHPYIDAHEAVREKPLASVRTDTVGHPLPRFARSRGDGTHVKYRTAAGEPPGEMNDRLPWVHDTHMQKGHVTTV